MGDISDVIDIDSIADELEYLYGTKQAIADAINEVGESQGITVTSADTFRSYADKIKKFGLCEVGKISVRTTPLYDEEIGTYQTFKAPEGKVWKEVKVHIDAWSAVTQEVDPLIISENGFYDINEMSASKFAFSEVQNPTGNPKQKGYFEKIKSKYYPTEDTEVVEGKTYYVEDKTKEYETASSFIINVQRAGAAPFTCDFYDEAGNVIEHHEGIPYGGWCQFEGTVPASSSGLGFQGWNPAPNNIQTNMKCYPKYYAPRQSSDEWGQSWAEIVVDHGANMPIGAWKALPLKDSKVTINGVDIPVPEIKMVKVFNGEDVSTSSFLSKDLVFLGQYASVISYGDHCNPQQWTGNAMFSEDAVYSYTDPNTGQKYHSINEYLLALFDIIPDYIRQFIIPVTKYSTTMLCPGANSYSRMTAMQQYLWIPSGRELGATDVKPGGYVFQYDNMVSDRGPVYSDAFPDNESRIARYQNIGQTYNCRETLSYNGSGLISLRVNGDGRFGAGNTVQYSKVGFCL